MTNQQKKNTIMKGDKEAKCMHTASCRVVYFPYGIAGLAVG